MQKFTVIVEVTVNAIEDVSEDAVKTAISDLLEEFNCGVVESVLVTET